MELFFQKFTHKSTNNPFKNLESILLVNDYLSYVVQISRHCSENRYFHLATGGTNFKANSALKQKNQIAF